MATIERADAILFVQTRADTDTVPTLAAEEVEDLVDRSARRDHQGTQPHEDGWWPTYDLHHAVASAWEVKASRAASRFDLTVDGQQLDRSQLYAHCKGQAVSFWNRVAGAGSRA